MAPAVSITIGAALGLAACGTQAAPPGKQAGGLASKSAGSGPSLGSSAKGGQLAGANASPASAGSGGGVVDQAGNGEGILGGSLAKKSCIYSVPDNAKVENGEIILPSGVTEKMKPCGNQAPGNPGGGTGSAAPPPAPAVAAVPAKAARSAAYTGRCYQGYNAAYWAGSCYQSGKWLEQMWERYTVPANPAKAGALVYLWGGLEDSSAGRDVLQDVLTWGPSPAVKKDPHVWYATPWYGSNGTYIHGHSIATAPGHTIDTALLATNCRSNGTYCNWGLVVTDLNTHQTTQFSVVSWQSFHIVFGADAEVYGATACSQMPANGYAAFRRLSIVNGYGKIVPASFGVRYPSPHCNVSMVQDPVWANIKWST